MLITVTLISSIGFTSGLMNYCFSLGFFFIILNFGILFFRIMCNFLNVVLQLHLTIFNGNSERDQALMGSSFQYMLSVMPFFNFQSNLKLLSDLKSLPIAQLEKKDDMPYFKPLRDFRKREFWSIQTVFQKNSWRYLS